MTEDSGALLRGPGAATESALAGTPAAAGAEPARQALPVALVRAARPKQWFKNVLVLAAPAAAGVLLEGPHPRQVALTFLALCFVASGTYLLNDVGDVESDRLHPRKRFRPIASGAVPIPLALAVGVGLMLAGFATAYLVGLGLLGVVVLYVVLSSLYTVWLKHLAVIDLAVIASFFIIRAVAGGVATGAYPSRWFLIVASFGSLFVVAGKRHGESIDLGDSRGAIRATLGEYTAEFLRYVWTLASGVTLAAYCLWAFEQSPRSVELPWFELSIIPFVLFVLRYALLIDAGKASAPEDVILGDRTLQVLGVVWVTVFGCGVYLVGG